MAFAIFSAWPHSSSRCSWRQVGRGRALHDLLVAPLHGAVALEEMHRLAVSVAQDLHLDVAGALDQFFQVDLVLAEGGRSLAARLVRLAFQFLLRADDPHAAPAAAPGGLQHDGVADLPRHAFHGSDVVG